MSDILGNQLKLSLFGESHGKMIGASLYGLEPGIKVDEEMIHKMLERRKARNNLSTSRREEDSFEFISGVYQGYTTGNMITVLMKNQDVDDTFYQERSLRPSHADYTALLKYKGYDDYRGGGHFSGRMTAPIVALGGLVLSYLESKDIHIATRVRRIHDVEDDDLTDLSLLSKFRDMEIPTVSKDKAEKMREEILSARENLDSVGGIIETYIYGNLKGIGNPFFDSLESKISHAVFSCPGVKGIEFGDGFKITSLYGSQANDGLRTDGKEITLESNHNGGINGGISNGMPIIFSTAIKPTPSIGKKQHSVNPKTMENIDLEIRGRHDPCIALRAIPVIESLAMIALLDAMKEGN